MKRKLVVLVLVMCLLNACNGTAKEESSKATFQIVIDNGKEKKLSIPDPTSEEYSDVVLRDSDLIDYDNDKYDFYMTDLSFIGINGEAVISNFAVGNVTSLDSSFANIKYSNLDKNKQEENNILGAKERIVNGNCLILSVTEKLSNEEVDESGNYFGEEQNYIVVLDYANKKNYKAKTDLEFAFTNGAKVDLFDLTGDGLDDIIVSNITNGHRTGIRCNIFRFGDNNLKMIYTNNSTEPDIFDKKYFLGELLDNYEAVIKCENTGFEDSFSLLNIGYEKKNLELSEAPKNSNADAYQFIRGYKNGQIIKGGIHSGHLYDIQCFTNQNLKSGMKFAYYIYMGKWDSLGIAHAYMQYDKEKDSIDIVEAEFERNSIE